MGRADATGIPARAAACLGALLMHGSIYDLCDIRYCCIQYGGIWWKVNV